MCRDYSGDHEIRADEEAEYAAAMAEAPPKPEPTDEELTAMWYAYVYMYEGGH